MNTILPPKENTIEYPQFNIFLCYKDIQPATVISLIGYNYQPIQTITDFSYSDFFRERWKEGKTFINIEQDIVVYPGAIEAIWNCPREFCAYDFHLPNHRLRNLENDTRSCPIGLVKISKEYIEKTPDLWDEDVMWNICDHHIIKPGIKIHQHFPSIVNANPALLGFVNYEGGK